MLSAPELQEGEGPLGLLDRSALSPSVNSGNSEERPAAADMILRLGRLTPGYFRLLQRQVSGEVQMQPQNGFVNQIAMTMATVGIGVSFYSARQMAERVRLKQPAS